MRCKSIPNPFPVSKCLLFLENLFIGVSKVYRLSVLVSANKTKIIFVFYQYRPIRNCNLSVVIGIDRHEKRLIGRPLAILFFPDIYLQEILGKYPAAALWDTNKLQIDVYVIMTVLIRIFLHSYKSKRWITPR